MSCTARIEHEFKNASAFLLRGARHAIALHTSPAHLCNPAGGYISWGIDSQLILFCAYSNFVQMPDVIHILLDGSV